LSEKGVEIIRKKEYPFCYKGDAVFAPCEAQSCYGIERGKKAKEVLEK